MIKEYQFLPGLLEYQFVPGLLEGIPDLDPEPITIDLRYVASAAPYGDGRTMIRINGASCLTVICEDYEHFVRDWQSVKR